VARRYCRAVIPLLLVAVGLAHAAPAPKTVTESAAGRTVAIAPHQLLRIQLDECDDCGFRWETTLKPDPAVLTQRRTIRKLPACAQQPGCVGGSETAFFRYVGDAAGRTKLRLGYFGPGRPSKPSESFRLTVRVR
jgi:hypothetical protein